MRLLNLGCGGERVQSTEWVNLDDLHSQLPPKSGARINLDQETNYVNFNVSSGPLPFSDGSFDGILASHFFEHFDAQEGLKIMRDCRRLLRSGGTLLVSVPDASYFRKVYPEDRNENWPRLFETTDPANPIPTFFEAALWFDQHKVLMTEDALWSYFKRTGFDQIISFRNLKRNLDGSIDLDMEPNFTGVTDGAPLLTMMNQLNRLSFSLVMCAVKE